MTNFNSLKKIWVSLLTQTGDFEEFWSTANDQMHRYNVPGGCPLSSGQSAEINRHIAAVVDGRAGGSAWDNFINFVPTTKLSKAARIAAKRDIVKNVPAEFFENSVCTRFGWELIQLDLDWDKWVGVCLRPKTTKYGDLSHPYFVEWVKSVDPNEADYLGSLSGPRQLAFVNIIIGKNWKNMFPIG